MTNLDTESRLRNYCRARAESIPDSAVPPGLDTEPDERRRMWPIVLAAAAITAVIALSVPLIRAIGPNEPAATSTDSPIAVPYILFSEQTGTLHDSNVKVELRPEDGVTSVLGRTRTGWLVQAMKRRGEPSQLGILNASGRFTPLDARDAMAGVLSPDRTKVAIADRIDDDTALLRIVDLASGAELGAIPAYPSTRLAGWNSDGIWFHESSTLEPIDMFVWRPGETTARRIGVGEPEAVLTAPASTDRMLAVWGGNESWCLRVVRLAADSKTLETLREHCGAGGLRYPTLSPDGRFVVVPEDEVAIEVDSGRIVNLRDMPDNVPPDNTMFEDATSVLVVTGLPTGTPRRARVPARSPMSSPNGPATSGLPDPFEQTLVVTRCRIDTASCDPIYQTPAGFRIRLGTP